MFLLYVVIYKLKYLKVFFFVQVFTNVFYFQCQLKGMERVPNIFMSFDKYLFLEVINILIYIGLFKQYEIQLFKNYLNPI